MTNKAMKVGKEQEALLDALIAGCGSARYLGRARATQSAAETPDGAGFECRADPSPGLRRYFAFDTEWPFEMTILPLTLRNGR
jgi:hypothetical protein